MNKNCIVCDATLNKGCRQKIMMKLYPENPNPYVMYSWNVCNTCADKVRNGAIIADVDFYDTSEES